MAEYKYKRVLLKLSGEALMGSRYFGIDPEVPQKSLDWINAMKAAGISLIIVSNNHPPRVKPFADILSISAAISLEYPLSPFLFQRAA